MDKLLLEKILTRFDKFKVCLIVDGHLKIGYGHVTRSLNLLRLLNLNKSEVLIVSICDEQCEDIFRKYGYYYKKFGLNDFVKAECYISFIINFPNVRCVITDLAYALPNKNIVNLEYFHIKLSKLYKLVIIDGFSKYSFRKFFNGVRCDLLLAPYVGEISGYGGIAPHLEYVGPEFAVVGKSYWKRKNKRIFTPKDNKVLLTCGGTDPYGITEEILALLCQCDQYLRIMITIGQGFNHKRELDMSGIVKSSRHHIRFLKAKFDLSKYFEWSDVAISSGGLTKYELAYQGVPAIYVAKSEEHLAGNSEFSMLNTSVSLDMRSNKFADNFNRTVLELLKDVDWRESFSKNGTIYFSYGKIKVLLTSIKSLIS